MNDTPKTDMFIALNSVFCDSDQLCAFRNFSAGLERENARLKTALYDCNLLSAYTVGEAESLQEVLMKIRNTSSAALEAAKGGKP